MPTRQSTPILFACAVSALLWGTDVLAADFSHAQKTYSLPTNTDSAHAQKIYVPASKVDRRLDFDALKVRASGSSSTDAANQGSPTQRASSQPATAKAATHTTSSLQERKKVEQLIAAGKLEDADLILRHAHSEFPGDILVTNDLFDLSLLRAKKLQAAKQYLPAATAARQALYLNSASMVAGDLLDAILKKTGINPKDASGRLKLADQLAAKGQTEPAVVEYRSALKLTPSAEAHLGLGNMAWRAGAKTTARQEYQSAIEANPSSSAAHRQIGLLKQSLGDNVGANTDLSQAVILNPQDKAAGKALVDIWTKQVAKNQHSANSHLGLARAYQLAGNLPAAQAQYREVVAIEPDHPNLPACRQSFKLAASRQEAKSCLEAAHTLESQGAIADALGKTGEALDCCPSDTQTLMYRGHLLEQLKQYQEAHDAYLEVLRDDPHNIEAAKRLQALPSLVPLPVRPASLNMPAGMPAFSLNGAAHTGSPVSALGQFMEQPPAPTIPTAQQVFPATQPQANDVSTLSSFLSQLRNQSLQQQKQDQAAERATHSVLDRLMQPHTSYSEPVNATACIAGVTSGNLLAGLDRSKNAPLAPLGSQVFTPASTASVSTAATDQVTYQQLLYLEQQNRTLAQKLQLAQQTIWQLNSTSPAATIPSNRSAGSAPAGDVNLVAPPSPEPADDHSVASTVQGQSLPEQAQMFRTGDSPVRLELKAVSTSTTAVKLRVLLENNQDVTLAIKRETQGIVRSLNRPDTQVKVSFHTTNIPAHGKIYGTVRIPTDKISPNSDLFIPNLLPASAGERDVHLTAAMSPAS